MSTQMVAGDKPMAVALDNVKVEVSKVSEDQDEEDTGVSVPKELMGGANVGVMVCQICLKLLSPIRTVSRYQGSKNSLKLLFNQLPANIKFQWPLFDLFCGHHAMIH